MDSVALARLREVCETLTDPVDLICYQFDATHQNARPDAVLLPRSADEVAAVLRVANGWGFPVTPRGAGTGLAGGSVAVQGGAVLSLARLNRIIEIDRRNLLAVVEPGVVTADLHRAAEDVGLFYPPDPASARASTIGGNLATNAGGPRCFKYGVTRDYVLGLEVVLPTGEILKTGGRTVKNVSGYDLTRLIVGSEGTLGVITKATLRLVPRPEATGTLMAVFARLEDAGRAVEAIVAAGVVPCSLELMDQASLQVVENYLGLGLPVSAEAVLLVEVDGYHETVQRQAEVAAHLCRENGAVEVKVASNEQEAADLWRARKAISPALARIKPVKIGEDVAVPPALIPEFLRRFRYLRERFGLSAVVFGHAGDGNLHPNVVIDPRNQAEVAQLGAWLEELARLALDLGGTLSGEHGIGNMKAPYLEWEVGAVGMQTMRAIKRALDPKGILNPGKLGL
ncbi:MAG TPA: FAD-linked oxidase C-terminal domain-containing protein [Symbiobacteriaceae bacterium]|nr:FAD-linked oxidase C-terminal domain-containing protein [Symbiobacteriaceae bacterium]